MRDLDIEIRAGVHTGEVELARRWPARDRRPPRVAASSRSREPGEVLVSQTTRDLVEGSGIAFTDRGEHQLKGIEGPRRVYAAD